MLTTLANEAGKSERDLLRETLEQTNSLREAALRLRMSETGIQWHMKKFGLRVERQVVTRVIER